MSFLITDETGFVTKDAINELPVITIAAKDSTLSLYVKAGNINWKRNSEFSTCDIEAHDARISAGSLLGSASLSVGTEIIVSGSIAGGASTVLFSGYIMAQSLRSVGGSDDSKEETVVLKCVDYKYDLYRETIIGQLGFQAMPDGTEALSGGIYGTGLGWFTGLNCVFNDRTFAKSLESAWSHAKSTTKHGNARKSDSLGTGDLTVCFDGNYFALNVAGEEAAILPGRNIAWSCWDMIRYVMFYCYAPPYSFPAALADAYGFSSTFATEKAFVEDKRIILGLSNGLETQFPENVDVQGLRASDAITKICAACGYSWTLEPAAGASVMKFWRTGTSLGAKKVYLGSGGSGMTGGLSLYNTSIAEPIAFPLVNKEKWNVDDLQIDIDYTQVIGCLIGTTRPIRVQNCFYLRKGWTSGIWFDYIKPELIAGTTAVGGQISLEANKGHFKDGEDGKKVRWEFRRMTNGTVKFKIGNLNDDEAVKLKGQDSFFSIMRRWITDETGLIESADGKARSPFNFVAAGLLEVNGSTYMVKPRPFLSKNIASAKAGDPSPPKTYFPKFSPGQMKLEIVSTFMDEISENRQLSEGLDGVQPTIKKGDKTYYPFGAKKGSIRVLDDRSGIFIEGGDLEMVNVTYDPKLNDFSFFAPIVIGAVEHDQAGLVLSRKVGMIGAGKLLSGRRWIDGKRYKIDIVQAKDQTKNSSPQQIKDGAATGDATDTSKIVADSVDEGKLLADDCKDMGPYYSAPIVSMRLRIPTITTAYKLGESITGIEGRVDFTADYPGICCIVAVQFDLKQFNTIISVESEVMNPNIGINEDSEHYGLG